MANSSVTAARRAMEHELKQAESDVDRLKAAIRALTAYENPRSKGKRMPNKKVFQTCRTRGCETRFSAKRSDARFCNECRRARGTARSASEEVKQRAAERAAQQRGKGVLLVKNTPKK